MKQPKTKATPVIAASKLPRILQVDVPAYSLDEAIIIAEALRDNFGGSPASPLRLAEALSQQPGSGHFRMLLGASAAFGLTNGWHKSEKIELTALGIQIMKPKAEDDVESGRRTAFLKPRVISEFLKKYDKSPLPKAQIGANVLEDLGVPQERANTVFDLICKGAEKEGFIRPIKDKAYVDLDGQRTAIDPPRLLVTPQSIIEEAGTELPAYSPSDPKLASTTDRSNRRVFITHGKNRAFVEPIKKLLVFGELEAIVSVERTTVAEPVPDKIIGEMRSCSAAIIHIDGEEKLLDSDTNTRVLLNDNVLIEIGAAMALFGRRFILLVKNGIALPSNLQGLFEVRYDSDVLDGTTTIKLLEAINALKSLSLPGK
jgi:predicted nucleotide-binding protein